MEDTEFGRAGTQLHKNSNGTTMNGYGGGREGVLVRGSGKGSLSTDTRAVDVPSVAVGWFGPIGS